MPYQCSICKFRYKTKSLSDKCYRWCSAHKSCNLEIIKHAIKD